MYIDLKTLSSTQGFKIFGASEGDQWGEDGQIITVRAKGNFDINNDGFKDIIIGAPYASPNHRQQAGEIYIVYGKKGGYVNDLDLSQLNNTYGFKILGANEGDRSGCAVSKAGDVNNDGIDDIIIGAYYASPLNRHWAGISYIIYGRRNGYTDIDLGSTFDNTKGFRILGASGGDPFGDQSGWSVSDAGDVNLDGVGDIIVGAPGASPLNRHWAGTSYVIYGNKNKTRGDVDLNALNASEGFKILGANGGNKTDPFGDQVGNIVGEAGDINCDGISDIIIGAVNGAPLNRSGAGETYIIYGKQDGYSYGIDLAFFSTLYGFKILGSNAGDRSGFTISKAGDVNDDNITDIVIGAWSASPLGVLNSGISYVIYGIKGGSNDIDLNQLKNSDGFRIIGANASDGSGIAVSEAGDINNDGIGDVLIGAFSASPSGRYQAGESYIIYGKRGGYLSDLYLAMLDNTQGFSIFGVAGNDYSGSALGGVGDVNGDQIDDIIIESFQASPIDRHWAGESYVIYGGRKFSDDSELIGKDSLKESDNVIT